MSYSIRRIIAAPTPDGSRIVADGPPPGVVTIREESRMGGALLWSTANPPVIEMDAEDATLLYPGFRPPPGETRFILVFFEPGALAEMHATETIDTFMVLEGEIELHVDIGPPTVCRAGDVMVCIGANHKWVNASDKVAKVFSTLVGATRVP